jgi:hypothetical protein
VWLPWKTRRKSLGLVYEPKKKFILKFILKKNIFRDDYIGGGLVMVR